MSWRLPAVIAALLTVGACASASSGGPEAIGPEDCSIGIPASDLLGAELPSIDQTRAHLGLMQELHADTRLLWDEFNIDAQHLMVQHWPRILIPTGATDDCHRVLEAVDHPELVVFVDWSDQIYDLVGMPPWRRLITADLEGAGNRSFEGPAYTAIGQVRYDASRATLRPDQEPLAAILQDRYQGLIDIYLGAFPYPPERVDPSQANHCQLVWRGQPATGVAVESMTLTGSIDDGLVEFVVTNTGTTTVHLVPSRTAELALPAGTELVTIFVGARTAEDRGSIRLDPGAQISMTARTATQPCNFNLGYALPAGAYEIVLTVQVFDQPASENSQSNRALVARLPIELP
ncbi:MAG: hypothetical protein GY925_29510 [Actinomycetia bacterium]|nr:hypothetical protein [Actinomycetes bacterium]